MSRQDTLDVQERVNSATLRVAVGPLVAPVTCRVVSIVAARADCPVDRLDDALLLCDVISAHAPAHVVDGHVGLAISAASSGLTLRLGPLKLDGAQAVIQDANVPGVGNVLERVADELSVERAENGEHLVMALRF